MSTYKNRLSLTGLVLLAGTACGGGEAPVIADGIPESLEAFELRDLESVDAVEAVGFTGPGDTPFKVQQRTTQIGAFPCTSCHTEGEASLASVRSRAQRTLSPNQAPATAADPSALRGAHQNIQPGHPSTSGGQCATCHSSTNLEELVLQNGTTASLDEAYRLCSGCHYQQADDWAGGAHGKRLAGWKGERVVMSCTQCHNPHAPAFDQRIPFPGPSIPRTGKIPTGAPHS